MNPDKMRSEYGKLIYMLMDSSDYQIQELLEFSCVRPLKTVYSTLKEHDLLVILEDPRMELATAEVIAGNRPRYEVGTPSILDSSTANRSKELSGIRSVHGKPLRKSMQTEASMR